MNRRTFLKSLFVGLVSFTFLRNFNGAFAKDKKEVAPPEGMSPVSESDAVASAVGYKHNAKDIDFTRYPDRKKPQNKHQSCGNCALYTSANEGWGKCQLITAGAVSAKGWCGSWSKKS